MQATQEPCTKVCTCPEHCRYARKCHILRIQTTQNRGFQISLDACFLSCSEYGVFLCQCVLCRRFVHGSEVPRKASQFILIWMVRKCERHKVSGDAVRRIVSKNRHLGRPVDDFLKQFCALYPRKLCGAHFSEKSDPNRIVCRPKVKRGPPF